MKFLNKEKKMEHNCYLYYGISLVNDEDTVFTLGITQDCFRRSYEKHMHIVWFKAYPTKAQAAKAETGCKESLDDVFDRAFVKFGAWEMKGYAQNRGWDWWYICEEQDGPLEIIKQETK